MVIIRIYVLPLSGGKMKVAFNYKEDVLLSSSEHNIFPLHTHTRKHTYIHTHIYIYTHTHTHTHIYIYIYIYIYQ